MFTPEPPVVVKVGSVEAGYGKMKVDKQEQMADVRSLLALHHDYVIKNLLQVILLGNC
jgi:hypothetical protein